MNTNWIQRINHIINYIQKKYKGLKLFILIISIIFVANVIPTYSWVIIFLIVFLFARKSLIITPKHNKTIKYLKKAIENIRTQNFSEALKYLILANEAYPNLVLQDLIKDFSEFYDITDYSEMVIVEKEIKKTKDKKDLAILEELKKTLQYIVLHKNKLEEINKKITSLEQDLKQAPDTYEDELENIINRYKNLRKLEEAKIEFYAQTKKELWNLHREYLFKNKIERERKHLYELESQYLTESVRESLEADEKASFIDFQSAYLEALSQYSDEVENVASSDLLEEIKKEFENKKRQIRNLN